jgi:beta-phosphoglucomutase-like phosphatase (HAD superfamily)
MSMSPGVCVVIATCSMSSKAAVSSGMRCVVIPDKFTAFQDFGGADYVSDELDEAAIDKAFSLLEDR